MYVPLPAGPFLSPSWPQCPSAVAASPFLRLQSQPAPLPSELESSCHIPLSPASDGIAVVPVLGFDPADMLNRCKMHDIIDETIGLEQRFGKMKRHQSLQDLTNCDGHLSLCLTF